MTCQAGPTGFSSFTGMLRGSTFAAGSGVLVGQPAWPNAFGMVVGDCLHTQIGMGQFIGGLLQAGFYGRIPLTEGTSLIDLAFIDPQGNDVFPFQLKYENGTIIYPWETLGSCDCDQIQADLGLIDGRLDTLESQVSLWSSNYSGLSSTVSAHTILINNLSNYDVSLDSRIDALEAITPGSFTELYRGTPNLTVFNSWLNTAPVSPAPPPAGVVFTTRSTTIGTNVSSSQEGFAFLKTQTFDGTICGFKDYLYETYVGLGLREGVSNIGVYSRVKNQRFFSGVLGCLGSAGNMTPGSIGVLGFRDVNDNIYAGYFDGKVLVAGNLQVIGNATLTGTAFGGWADFALTDSLMPIDEVISFISENGRLPWLSSVVGEKEVSIARKLTELAECCERLMRYIIQLKNERS